MEDSEKTKNVFKLVSGRPQDVIEQKMDETIELQPASMNRLVYITKCTKCEMVLKKKAAKILIENCQNVSVTLHVGLVTGSVEVIGSENITINVAEDVAVSI